MKIEGSSGRTTFNQLVDCAAGLVVAGQTVARPPWVAGRVQGVQDPEFPLVNGPIPILNNVGQQSFTCTRTQAGVFSIEFPTAHPSGNLPSVHITHGGAPMFSSYNWGNNRRFGVYFWGPKAVLADPDVEFSFTTIP